MSALRTDLLPFTSRQRDRASTANRGRKMQAVNARAEQHRRPARTTKKKSILTNDRTHERRRDGTMASIMARVIGRIITSRAEQQLECKASSSLPTRSRDLAIDGAIYRSVRTITEHGDGSSRDACNTDVRCQHARGAVAIHPGDAQTPLRSRLHETCDVTPVANHQRAELAALRGAEPHASSASRAQRHEITLQKAAGIRHWRTWQPDFVSSA